MKLHTSVGPNPAVVAMFMKEKGMDTWSKEKQDEMKKKMGASYAIQFVASLVMFYVLAGLIVGFGKTSLTGGVLTGTPNGDAPNLLNSSRPSARQ